VHSSTTETPQYMAPKDVAELLGFTAETVCRWIRDGELQAVNLGGGKRLRPRWIIRRAQLEAFLLARSTLAKEQTPQPQQRRRRDPDVIKFY
jgi:excisionase family DNA binding protein